MEISGKGMLFHTILTLVMVAVAASTDKPQYFWTIIWFIYYDVTHKSDKTTFRKYDEQKNIIAGLFVAFFCSRNYSYKVKSKAANILLVFFPFCISHINSRWHPTWMAP